MDTYGAGLGGGASGGSSPSALCFRRAQPVGSPFGQPGHRSIGRNDERSRSSEFKESYITGLKRRGLTVKTGQKNRIDNYRRWPLSECFCKRLGFSCLCPCRSRLP